VNANSLEVNVMHALRRPHLPNAVGVSLAGALLAIVITLVLANALGDGIPFAAGVRTLARHPTSLTVVQPVARPRWVSDPFASLLARPLPPWQTALR
jgi:F0F1-type ATP synthase membrane subunit c/vacuolar-type H+-ATPase subunit K